MDTPVEGACPAEEVREQANSLTAPPITTGGPCSLLVKHSCRNCSRGNFALCRAVYIDHRQSDTSSGAAPT